MLKQPRLTPLLVVLALLTVQAIIRGQLFFAYFQVDDFNWLRLAQWPSVMASFHGPWGHGLAYRPISRVSFYLDEVAFGWRAGAWHAENLLINSICALALFCLGRRLGLEAAPSFAAALLFSISPLGSENVDWISGRTGSLCLVFLLSAVLCWIGGFQNRKRWAVTVLLYVLAMMTYEPGVILPLLLICLIPFLPREKEAFVVHQVFTIASLMIIGIAFWTLRAHLVGAAGTDVDPLYSSVWTAIPLNAGAAVQTFRGAWGIIGIAIVGSLILVSLGSAQTRLRAIGLIAMAAIFYLPYGLVIGVAPRFLFMSQVPLCLLIVFPFAMYTGRMKAVLTIGAVCLFIVFGRTTYRRATGTARASNVVRSILEQIVKLEADYPSNLVIDGIPDAMFGYPLFSFNFEMAARTRLGPNTPLIARSSSVLADPTLLRAALQRQTRFFQFDATHAVLQEENRNAWISLNAGKICNASRSGVGNP